MFVLKIRWNPFGLQGISSGRAIFLNALPLPVVAALAGEVSCEGLAISRHYTSRSECLQRHSTSKGRVADSRFIAFAMRTDHGGSGTAPSKADDAFRRCRQSRALLLATSAALIVATAVALVTGSTPRINIGARPHYGPTPRVVYKVELSHDRTSPARSTLGMRLDPLTFDQD